MPFICCCHVWIHFWIQVYSSLLIYHSSIKDQIHSLLDKQLCKNSFCCVQKITYFSFSKRKHTQTIDDRIKFDVNVSVSVLWMNLSCFWVGCWFSKQFVLNMTIIFMKGIFNAISPEYRWKRKWKIILIIAAWLNFNIYAHFSYVFSCCVYDHSIRWYHTMQKRNTSWLYSTKKNKLLISN